MDPREELQALRRLAELEAKAGGGMPPQQDNLALAKQVVQQGPTTGQDMMKFYGKPAESLPQYAGRAVKEMAIPMATTAVGTATGGLGGAMAGSALGETLNQALGVYGQSVIPEANKPDMWRIGIAGLAPAVIPTVVKGAQGVNWLAGHAKDAVKHAVEPLSPQGRDVILARFRATLANNDPKLLAQLADAADNAPMHVPGSQPTAAQAISGVPESTGFAAHEHQLSHLPGISTKFAGRMTDQETARSNAMATVAKTPAMLDAAIQSRQTVTEPLYDAAKKKLLTSDQTLGALMDRPSMEKVFRRAAELAQEKGDPFQIGKNLPARTVTSPIVSASGQPITQQLPAQFAQYPTKSLHYMKMALDDLTRNPERFGIGANEVQAIQGTRKEFVDWLVKNNPDYGVARDTYRMMSDAPNRMQVGQYLQGKLDSPLETVGGVSIPQSERAGVMAQAVKDAPKTIKNAMGRDLYDTLDQVLTPQETQTVTGIVKDLARNQATKKFAEKTNLSGSDAIPGNVGGHLPNLLYRPAMIANYVMKKMGASAEDLIGQKAAGQHLDKKEFAKALRMIPQLVPLGPQAPSRYDQIIQELLRRQAPLAAGAATQQP